MKACAVDEHQTLRDSSDAHGKSPIYLKLMQHQRTVEKIIRKWEQNAQYSLDTGY
jgi:hypothetical protein